MKVIGSNKLYQSLTPSFYFPGGLSIWAVGTVFDFGLPTEPRGAGRDLRGLVQFGLGVLLGLTALPGAFSLLASNERGILHFIWPLRYLSHHLVWESPSLFQLLSWGLFSLASLSVFKTSMAALAGVAQWIEHHTGKQRVTGLIHSRICLGCGPGPQ